MIKDGGDWKGWLWGTSGKDEPKEVAQEPTIKECQDLTDRERLAIDLLKKICPNPEIHRPDRISKIVQLINDSKNFSQSFKDRASKMLKSRTIVGIIQEPRNYIDVMSKKYKSENGFIVVGKDDIDLNMNLSNVINGYETYNKISVKFPGVRLLGLKKTETSGSKYLILIRVINLYDLQKYGDDPLLTQLYDKCENPNITANVLTEVELCLKDVHFTNVKPKYVVAVYNVRFYIDNTTNQEKSYIGLYLVTNPIDTLDGLAANLKIYGNKDKQNYENYELSIVQKGSVVQTPTRIHFGQVEKL
jgi:hypothetical protein